MRLLKWLLPLLLALVAGAYWLYKNQGTLVTRLVVTNMLDQLDQNGDGVLTETEGFAGMFSLLDSNGDGQADQAELTRFIARSTKPFSWVNPPAEDDPKIPGLQHHTFYSSTLGTDVGYNIYLPPDYQSTAGADQPYPVIYYLHGGRPGNESLSIGIAEHVHQAVDNGAIRPVIVVWANGGKVSHYNYKDSPGEDVFVHELIPHIDASYRTIANRGGRALQGFSQGGRGTTRIMFKHADKFISAAPGGAGYAVEKQIAENNGVEIDQRQGADATALDFGKGNDAYSLARRYADENLDNSAENQLHILVWGGDKGFNYSAVIEYLDFLDELGIEAQQLIALGIDHNPLAFYQSQGLELLQFHEQYWRANER